MARRPANIGTAIIVFGFCVMTAGALASADWLFILGFIVLIIGAFVQDRRNRHNAEIQ